MGAGLVPTTIPMMETLLHTSISVASAVVAATVVVAVVAAAALCSCRCSRSFCRSTGCNSCSCSRGSCILLTIEAVNVNVVFGFWLVSLLPTSSTRKRFYPQATFWTSRGHRCLPFFPPACAFILWRTGFSFYAGRFSLDFAKSHARAFRYCWSICTQEKVLASCSIIAAVALAAVPVAMLLPIAAVVIVGKVAVAVLAVAVAVVVAVAVMVVTVVTVVFIAVLV